METKPFEDLKPNPKNPRRIDEHDFKALKKSIAEFGDLSGIVFNLTTGQLVGGHQRVQSFKTLGGKKLITYTSKFYDQPSRVGTVAYGNVWLENEPYPYREVQWPIERETAANIAANRIEGEFDLDLLAEANYMLAQEFPDLLELTGQREDEITDLLKMSGAAEQDPAEAPADPPMVIKVECDSDQQMTDLFNELKGRGLKVRVT